MSAPRVLKLIEGVHMGLGHDGLRLLIKKNAGLDVAALGKGDLVMCINRAGDKMKIIGCQGLVLGYLKMPKTRPIMRDALRFIPETFGGAGFNYESACRKALYSRLKPSVTNDGPILATTTRRVPELRAV